MLIVQEFSFTLNWQLLMLIFNLILFMMILVFEMVIIYYMNFFLFANFSNQDPLFNLPVFRLPKFVFHYVYFFTVNLKINILLLFHLTNKYTDQKITDFNFFLNS